VRIGLISFNARQGDAIGQQVAEKLAFFRQRGAEVRVFVEDSRELHSEVTPFCHTVTRPRPAGAYWEYLTACDWIAAEYGQSYPLLDRLPLLSGGKPRILIDYHGITPPALWGPHNAEALARGVARRGLLWCADLVLVHSRFTYNELRRELHLPAERLLCQAYPVDLPPEAAAATGATWRRSLGLGDARVLLYVGRLAPNKQVPLLVEALHELRELRPEVHLLIAGDDRDLYQAQAEECRRRAAALGLEDRVHLLGHLTGKSLWDAYRCADLFVTASAWESFCIPVAEAMALGVPVIAARTTALPETVGDAGLTFTPGDAVDLARVARRVLDSATRERLNSASKQIAVVNGDTGNGQVSGVAGSLRTVAEALRRTGHQVEFLAEFASATSLLSVLGSMASSLDAIIAGPYLSPIAQEVAGRWPEKTLLLPCFHDEPEARSAHWRDAYQGVAGLLFHSEAEQSFALAELGCNHPHCVVIGALLSPVVASAGIRPPARRSIVYCGRLTVEKNVPLLLQWAGRYARAHPDRFVFRFLGDGNVPLPREPWVETLGVVPESTRAAVLAQADALVQLSCNESLSLAALEAWQQGTPVIAHAGCAVLADHLANCGGGALAGDYAAFGRALDDLWYHPQVWQDYGWRGQEYIRRQYENEGEFVSRLEQALAGMHTPLAESMRIKGQTRAAQFSRTAWRERLATALAQVSEQQAVTPEMRVEVRRRVAERTAAASDGMLLVPVEVWNWGAMPAPAEGPARVLLCARILDETSGALAGPVERMPLPHLVIPGEKVAAAVAVTVPEKPGTYRVSFWAEPAKCEVDALPAEDLRLSSAMRLVVVDGPVNSGGCCAPLLDGLRPDLDEAERLQHLPDDYLDITQGALARVKRTIKHKLLNNFKTAYVDVLSRQQSAFNRQLLSVVEELVRCCEVLDHAVADLQRRRRRRRKKLMK
jgi:glycosyltransferase involved in cell wall biosynthesis